MILLSYLTNKQPQLFVSSRLGRYTRAKHSISILLDHFFQGFLAIFIPDIKSFTISKLKGPILSSCIFLKNLFPHLFYIFMEVVKMRKENKLGKQISKSLKVKKQQRNQEGQELLIEAKHAKIPRHQKAILNKSKFKRDLSLYSMFESSSTYILDDFNSFTLYNQKFYNLLKMKPQGSKFKTFKCTCSKSMCDSRYCECFAAGQICSHDCNCKNCKNVDQLRHLQGTNKLGNETMGCRCQKSECLKNYCECFQRGERCDSKCQCKNCLNGF